MISNNEKTSMYSTSDYGSRGRWAHKQGQTIAMRRSLTVTATMLAIVLIAAVFTNYPQGTTGATCVSQALGVVPITSHPSMGVWNSVLHIVPDAYPNSPTCVSVDLSTYETAPTLTTLAFNLSPVDLSVSDGLLSSRILPRDGNATGEFDYGLPMRKPLARVYPNCIDPIIIDSPPHARLQSVYIPSTVRLYGRADTINGFITFWKNGTVSFLSTYESYPALAMAEQVRLAITQSTCVPAIINGERVSVRLRYRAIFVDNEVETISHATWGTVVMEKQ